MLVKQYRLLVVLSAVMWTAWSRSVTDSDTQNSSPPYTTEDYIEPQTTPSKEPPGCFYGDRHYMPGEYIYQEECRSAQCLENDDIHYEDKYCEHCGAEEPSPCCPVCESMVTSSTTEDYTEPETSLITEVFTEPDTTEYYIEPEYATQPPPRCFYGNKYYEVGEYIYNDACGSEQCTKDGIEYVDVFCDYGDCNQVEEPNDCCPACEHTTEAYIEPETFPTTESVTESDTTEDYTEPYPTTTPDTTEHCITPEMPPTEPPSTEPPGCIYGNKRYEIGEYISYQPCTRVRCTINGPLQEGTLCQSDAGCNTDWPANDCCPKCDVEERRRRRRNLERTKVKRHAFRFSAKRYRLMRKRDAFVKA